MSPRLSPAGSGLLSFSALLIGLFIAGSENPRSLSHWCLLYTSVSILTNLSRYERCRYKNAPNRRASGSGIQRKTALNEPEDLSRSVTNLAFRKSYLKYSIFFSTVPNPSLKRRKPSFIIEVLPKCKEDPPCRAYHFAASHIIKLFPRRC